MDTPIRRGGPRFSSEGAYNRREGLQTWGAGQLASFRPWLRSRRRRAADVPEQRTFAGGLIGSIVSGCGRPVLATPYIQKDPASFDNVVVAWDASASAARALGDAIPILKRAKSVEIVTVANGMLDPNSPGGADVVRHLARHGIQAAFRAIPGGIDAAEMLLSYVADSDAKMMVTGAYGHSRVVETVVGGATRTLLDSMTIPLLMSH